MKNNKDLFAYPNPTNGTVNINFELNNTANVQLLIYDGVGRIVATLLNNSVSPGKQTYTYDLSNLAPGIYVCKLITDDQFEVTSIVKH
jgi:hypothetical protein